MTDILYERMQSVGPIVRVRRVSPAGEAPVRAVIEVDRRGAMARSGQQVGNPPPLMQAEGATDADVLTKLLPSAMEDAELARLMRDRGLR